MADAVFPAGTRVIALKNVGIISDGQPGIITGIFYTSFFFIKRPIYLCTFLGNMKCAMKPTEVTDHDHGKTLAMLERDTAGLSPAEQIKQIFEREN